MFEKYTEKARRIIFFARYEASQFRTPYIETEHLLMGLTREDKALMQRVHINPEAVRKEVESRSGIRDKIPTSVDLPLSQECQRALTYAAEEATALGHDFIDTGHVLLGLMREEKTLSSIILRQQGVNYEELRDIVRESAAPNRPMVQRQDFRGIVRALGRQDAPGVLQDIDAAARSLKPLVLRLQELVEGGFRHAAYTESYGEQRLKRKPWSRKQAVGHLIDCATTHHQWLARALTEPELRAHGHPTEEWVAAQQYQTFSWQVMMDLWIGMNSLLIHVMAAIPEAKLNTACRIGIDEPIPLRTVIERYVAYSEDLVGQILARL
ncbi:MAG TPA: Clp protease N-terminal domain-containing protein [Bryobacteraceae bacterium]|nr:Clp protease N-terminal domain-containing protein [Bryobacteraceae bacterium]